MDIQMEIFHICCVYLRTTKLNSDIIKVGILECIVAVKADALCSCLLLPRANKHTRNKRSVSITINRFHIVRCVMRDRSSSNFWYRDDLSQTVLLNPPIVTTARSG